MPVPSLLSSSTAAESHLKRLVLQVGTSDGTVTCSAALNFSCEITRLITHELYILRTTCAA